MRDLAERYLYFLHIIQNMFLAACACFCNFKAHDLAARAITNVFCSYRETDESWDEESSASQNISLESLINRMRARQRLRQEAEAAASGGTFLLLGNSHSAVL